MVAIQEQYKDFKSPPLVRKSIERMLSGIPSQRLFGLHSIVLTNSQALNREQKRKYTYSRKKKFPLERCQGLYYKKWQDEPAYIKIFVDNILQFYPSWLFRSRVLTDLAFSETLFHEIGHHIHATQAPEFSEREDIANNWKKKLAKHYFWNKYWYIIALLLPFRSIVRWLSNKANKKRK